VPLDVDFPEFCDVLERYSRLVLDYSYPANHDRNKELMTIVLPFLFCRFSIGNYNDRFLYILDTKPRL
jgi:hypothetical protein